ncbi:MAG: hypothetical protein K9L98_03530 [Candidatus Pacebacteria bacterium]|nr:hypothetical protein [Candidatus Paceibacterota bacterium]MCF7863049.1 hypothetical protein [Candidatus Paceibacterota bacterium]
MNKLKLILILGVAVVILPYLGIPYFFKNILFALLGIAIALLAYALHRLHANAKESKDTPVFDNFSENIEIVVEEQTISNT